MTLNNNEMKEYYFFVKFGSRSRLESLNKTGKLYMKNLKYFVDLEEKSGIKGRGDILEASTMIIKRHEMFINGKKVEISEPPGILREKRHLNHPVFCMMIKNVLGNSTDDNCTEYRHKLTFDNRLLEDFQDDETPHALIIHDSNEFIKRLDVALDNLKVPARRGLVKYRNKNYPKIVDGNLCEDDVFTKDISFSYQKEYRVLVEQDVEDHFILDIGNLEDISYICEANTLKNGLEIVINTFV